MDIDFTPADPRPYFIYAHECAHRVLGFHPISLAPGLGDDFDTPVTSHALEEELALYQAIIFKGFYGSNRDRFELSRLVDAIHAATKAAVIGRVVLFVMRRRQFLIEIYKGLKLDTDGAEPTISRWWSPHVSPNCDEEDVNERINQGCSVYSFLCFFGHLRCWKSSLNAAKSSKLSKVFAA